MTVILNGRRTEMAAGASVADAIAASGHAGSSYGVAVAVNGEVVPRSQWQTTSLSVGDKVEVLVAAQGG